MKKTAKIFVILIILLFCFSLFGCDNGLRQGYVTNKKFKPENTTTMITYTYIYTGNTIIPMPHFWYYHYPDRWVITIQNEEKENIFYVDEETYNSVKIGDWFDGTSASTEEPCIKKKED